MPCSYTTAPTLQFWAEIHQNVVTYFLSKQNKITNPTKDNANNDHKAFLEFMGNVYDKIFQPMDKYPDVFLMRGVGFEHWNV